MRYRIFNLLAAALLLLGVASAAAWVRGYRWFDAAIVHIGNYKYYICWPRGQIMLARQVSHSRPPLGYELDSHPVVDLESQYGGLYHAVGGFGYLKIPDIFIGIFAPTWFVLLMMLAFPVWWFRFERRRLRKIQRHRDGQCVACGYDLRASPERCPECGAIVEGQ